MLLLEVEDDKHAKSISQIVTESKDKMRSFELQKMQLKTKRAAYGKELKEYNSLANRVSQYEVRIEKIERCISSLKTKQEVVLSNVSVDDYKANWMKAHRGIVQGFALFLGFDMEQLPSIQSLIKSEICLKQLLETGESIQRNEYACGMQKANPRFNSNASFETVRNFIMEIKAKIKSGLPRPFDILYEYMNLFYLIEDKESELHQAKETIEGIANEKNALFIKLKGIENDISRIEVIVNDYDNYKSLMNNLIEETKTGKHEAMSIQVNDYSAPLQELTRLEKKIIRNIKSFNGDITSKGSTTANKAKNNVLKCDTFCKAKRTPMSSLLLTSHTKPQSDVYSDKARGVNMTNCSASNVKNRTLLKQREVSPIETHPKKKLYQVHRLSKKRDEGIQFKEEARKESFAQMEQNKNEDNTMNDSTSINQFNSSKQSKSIIFDSLSHNLLSFNNTSNCQHEVILSPNHPLKRLNAAKNIKDNAFCTKTDRRSKMKSIDLNLFYVDKPMTSDGCCVSCT